MTKNFKDRKVDKLKVDKSKEYLWKFIQKKKGLAKKPAVTPVKIPKKKQAGLANFLTSLFMPKKIAWASAIAVVVIIAIIVGPNLQNLLRQGLIGGPPTVSAHFEMTADNQDSAGIEQSSSFTLTASEDIDAATIEANINVEPEVDLNVTKTGDGTYKIAAAGALEANTVYQFTIISQTDEGPQEYSWAYQVKDTFKITGTLPGDKSAGVPTTSGIEIYFSHEQFEVEDAEQYFEITPAVEGYFEKHQRALVYVPLGGLKTSTVYTVNIKEGLPLAGSDQTLQETKSFQFETAQMPDAPKREFYFNQDYYEIGANQTIALNAYRYKGVDDAEEEELTVDIYKFSGLDAYLNAVEEKSKIPSWTRFARSNYFHDTNTLEYIGNVEALLDSYQWKSYIYLPDAELTEGFYIFEVTTDKGRSQALVQVTNLAAYATLTRTDSLIWVNDVNTKLPVKDAKVEILQTGQSFTTGADGVALFKVDPKEKAVYTFKITSPDNQVLITQVSTYVRDFTGDNYWLTILTDRPMYQPKDTIHFWGFIKPKYQGIDTGNLKMKLNRGWMETLVEEVEFTMDTENTYSGTVDLEDVPPGYYQLALYNGDELIVQEYISVETYVKPTFDITIDSDKKAVFGGETVHYDISTHFFDGTPVPYMKLTYYEDATGKEITTDANGKADFDRVETVSYKCEKQSSYCYDTTTNTLRLSPQLAEDTNIIDEATVRVFKSHLNVDAETDTEQNTATVNMQTNWIDLSRLNDGTASSYSDYLGDIASSRKVKGYIYEIHWDKIEKGEHYDFINKKVVKEYEYKKIENEYEEFSVQTDENGKASYEFEMNPERYYKINLFAPDDEGKDAHRTVMAYGSKGSARPGLYYMEVTNGEEKDYRQAFKINDTVEIQVKQSDEPLGEDAKGRFLYVEYNNGLIEYKVSESSKHSFIFGKEQIPNVTVRGTWFTGDIYQTIYPDYAYYNTEEKELDIEVNTDKESYEPGGKVTLKVKVKDKNGKPVKAFVNFNLVDEAYFKVVYDIVINPIRELYSLTGDGVIGGYTSHKNPLEAVQGDMGGCFTAGTKILTEGGEYKSIEDIKIGDHILTKQTPFSEQLVKGRVANTVEHLVNEYLVINESLEVTKEHILFVNSKWDIAGNVRVGDVLHDKNGNEVPVVSVRVERNQAYVYNFEVEGYHTYFANDFYVHNDKGGDGVRSDFEDVALFETISTNGNGEGTVTFQLPDNITSWRVVASAVDGENLQAGSGVGSVKVTLPMFGDLMMNKEYSVKDSPVIGMRAYGNDLSQGDDVVFNITAESLGVEKSDDIEGKAFEASYFDLPDLSIGTHTIQLDSKSGNLKDALAEDIEVKGSRLKESVVEILPTVNESTEIPLPDEGYAEIYFMDGGVSGYYGSLLGLYHTKGERLDQRLSEVMASELLQEYFDQPFSPKYEFNVTDYQKGDGGLALLPYGDSDLRLSALLVAVENDPHRYSDLSLKEYFYKYYQDTESSLEQIALSLLGLATMNEPVLNSLQTIKNEPSLSLSEKLYLGIAFERIGSRNDALEIYFEVKDELENNNGYETALGAMLAASLQKKDDAIILWDYVDTYGIKDDIVNLYLLGLVKDALEYASPNPVSFTVRPGNRDEKVTLSKCETYSTLVSEMKGISVKDIEGDLAAVVFYEESIEPEDFPVNERINITRSYTVFGEKAEVIREDDIVKITLTILPTKDLPDTGYHIVDIVPSGLRILQGPSYGSYSNFNHPYRIYNQEAHFYWSKHSSSNTKTYYAKVVHPGEFYADPAKIESFRDPEIANISSSDKIKIVRIEAL